MHYFIHLYSPLFLMSHGELVPDSFSRTCPSLNVYTFLWDLSLHIIIRLETSRTCPLVVMLGTCPDTLISYSCFIMGVHYHDAFVKQWSFVSLTMQYSTSFLNTVLNTCSPQKYTYSYSFAKYSARVKYNNYALKTSKICFFLNK